LDFSLFVETKEMGIIEEGDDVDYWVAINSGKAIGRKSKDSYPTKYSV
jgi:hypothetical protein